MVSVDVQHHVYLLTYCCRDPQQNLSPTDVTHKGEMGPSLLEWLGQTSSSYFELMTCSSFCLVTSSLCYDITVVWHDVPDDIVVVWHVLPDDIAFMTSDIMSYHSDVVTQKWCAGWHRCCMTCSAWWHRFYDIWLKTSLWYDMIWLTTSLWLDMMCLMTSQWYDTFWQHPAMSLSDIICMEVAVLDNSFCFFFYFEKCQVLT